MADGVFRVLKIPAGKEEDADGRGIGSDWLVADLFCDDAGTRYWLTTDYLHASDWADLPWSDPETLAQTIVEHLNAKAAALFEYRRAKREER